MVSENIIQESKMKKWNVGWGTVSLCNMKCQFCYSKSRRSGSNDLKLQDWKWFIDTNHEHINSINYGTGENTLSDEWFSLVNYIRKNYPSIKQSLTTNGYVSEAMKESARFETICDCIDEMDVSLDYRDPERHNSFRGQNKAYDWAISTLKLCQSINKQTTIVCLGSALNTDRDNIKGIFEIAQKYNSIVRMNLYRPTIGINSFTSQFILDPNELVSLLYWIDMNYDILSISDVLFSSLLTECVEQDPSGIDSIRVLPNGDITPSTYLIDNSFVVGNIKEPNVLQGLENSDILARYIHEVIPCECENCMYVGKCKGGVYDRRYLWNGSLNHKDPYCLYSPGSSAFDKVNISEKPFSSVHHGYLPTMFFAPR